ncbi:MAG: hypothetical protein EA415_11980 [Sphaerobacteraceae bacterium]|nr:MAG: hypothetical protein EA415_11980 [Sphaerobacteraceae bacterium]
MTRDVRQENFSVVAREPSGSRSIRSLVRTNLRFERRSLSILRKFQRLSDDDLLERIIVSPALQELTAESTPPARCLTASTGLPDLLRRAATLTGLTAPETDLITIDNPPDSGLKQTPLFGYESSAHGLDLVDELEQTTVVALIVRPGENTLQLTGAVANGQDHARSALEDIIRDHIEQWMPEHRLWAGPIEQLDLAWTQHARDRWS